MTASKHVLVTGGTGFIGRHLVRFLARQPGLTVWGISRCGGQVGDVTVEPVDLSSREEVLVWHRGKPTFEAAFHLAAILPVSRNSIEAEESFGVNVSMAQNALSIAVRDGAAFIYASGSSVYGVNRDIPLTEDMLPRPDNFYSFAKHVGEGLCEVAHVRHGLAAVALRISAPYGPQQTAHTVVNIFLHAALQSRDLTLHGTGTRTQDFTFIDDVVQAMWLAYEKRRAGVYNIASGQPVTMRELAETVLSVVPGTRSQIVFTGKSDPEESYRGVFAIEKARCDLGYAPRTTLAQGLRACVATMLKGEG